MKKYINEILGLIVMLVAFLAAIGWATGIESLATVKYGWIIMKPWTAFGLFTCGLSCISYAYANKCNSRLVRANLRGHGYACACWIALLQLVVIVDWLYIKYTTGTNVFLSAGYHVNSSIMNLVPSLVTTFTLLIYGLSGVFGFIKKTAGGVVASVGGVVLLGYALGLPMMYFDIHGFLTPVAANTGFCFLLLGIAKILETVQHDRRRN